MIKLTYAHLFPPGYVKARARLCHDDPPWLTRGITDTMTPLLEAGCEFRVHANPQIKE